MNTTSRRRLAAFMIATWTVLCLARTGSRVFDSVWAEDASVFLQDARDQGVVAVLNPYNDYLHVLPRLLAIPASWVPLQLAPVALSTLAALGMAVCAYAVYRSSRVHVASAGVRFALATYLVLLPGYGVEVANNITYLQWPMVLASTWICLAPPTKTGAAFLVLASLSAPQVIVLAPIVGWRAWKARDTLYAWVCALALSVQWGVIAVLHREADLQVPTNPIGLFIQRGLGTTIFGDRLNEWAWADAPLLYAVAITGAAIAAGAAFVHLQAEGRGSVRNLVALLLGLGVAFFVFHAIVRSSSLPTVSALNYGAFNGARYFVPTVFLFGCAAIVLAGELAKIAGGIRNASLLAGSLTLLLACSTSFTTPFDLHGTSWRNEYANAELACREGAETAVLHVDPLGDWELHVFCADISPRAPVRLHPAAVWI